jgi:RNA polymerase sigma factor (sigma-70 family)
MTIDDFNKCVDTHADGLYRFILKNIRDEEKAKDIVQDTYEKMWMKAETITAEKAKSYMFTTAYHTMIDSTRRDKKVGDMSEANMASLNHNNQYTDLKQILNEAVSKLPEIQRSVVLLRDYEGYNYQEIGDIMNISESQVKVYIFRARKFLKNYIGSLDVVI